MLISKNIRTKYLLSSLSHNAFKKTKFTQLPNRSLLILNGPDAHKLIQGVATNDVRQIKTYQENNKNYQKVAFYTLFLQPKGKIITDAFVFQPRMYQSGKAVYSSDQLWLDIPKQGKSALKSHLRKHMWKKEVELHDVEDDQAQFTPKIYSGYVKSPPIQNQDSQLTQKMFGTSIELQQSEQGQDDTYSNLMYFDPRGKKFGIRIVSMQPELQVQGHFEHQNLRDHQKLFQTLGEVPFSFMSGKLPFQFNFDLKNGVSLKKGCFLGQEIVSRGLMAGIIRRRTFPFLLQDRTQSLQPNSIIKTEDGQQLGKIMFSNQGQGIALVNYIPLLQRKAKWPIDFVSPIEGTLLNPFEQKLNSYFESMKHKQKILQDLQL